MGWAERHKPRQGDMGAGVLVCGGAGLPADGTPAHEKIDRFATFLRIIDDAPRDAEGHYLINPRALAYAKGEDVDPMGCTGLTARWCPRHGDCICGIGDDGERDPNAALDDTSCPLHGSASDHPWPDEAELSRKTLIAGEP